MYNKKYIILLNLILILFNANAIELENIEEYYYELSFFSFNIYENSFLMATTESKIIQYEYDGNENILVDIKADLPLIFSVDAIDNKLLCLVGHFHINALTIYDLKCFKTIPLSKTRNKGNDSSYYTHFGVPRWINEDKIIYSVDDPIDFYSEICIYDLNTEEKEIIKKFPQNVTNAILDINRELGLILYIYSSKDDNNKMAIYDLNDNIETEIFIDGLNVRSAVIISENEILILKTNTDNKIHYIKDGIITSSFKEYSISRGVYDYNSKELFFESEGEKIVKAKILFE